MTPPYEAHLFPPTDPPDKEFTLSSGVAKSFYVTLPGSTTGHLTLAWSDPAGSPPAYGSVVDPPASMLVNDLDLSVQDTATEALHLPWILDPDLPRSGHPGKRTDIRKAAATQGADHLNLGLGNRTRQTHPRRAGARAGNRRPPPPRRRPVAAPPQTPPP